MKFVWTDNTRKPLSLGENPSNTSLINLASSLKTMFLDSRTP